MLQKCQNNKIKIYKKLLNVFYHYCAFTIVSEIKLIKFFTPNNKME